MSEIDWSKAPEGATHYWPCHGSFYTKIGDKFYFAENIEVGRVNSPASWVKSLIPRPSPAWSGDGLPPVGVVLEVNPDKAGWRKSVISYVGDGFIAWMQVGDLIVPEYGAFIDDCEFRPIRTPEQIAADERTHEIRNALTSISHKVEKVNTDIDCSLAIAETVSAMIDAGYRKP